MENTRVIGLLLAAGAGRRMGGPKALLRDPDGTPWVVRSVRALAEGGCVEVVVVVGAAAGSVSRLLPAGVRGIRATDWAEGMGASLRSGLAALSEEEMRPVDAVLVSLVDTPGVTREVVARLRAVAGPDVLARAGYQGRPGHPVLIGRQHWPGVLTVARGDRGARDYLTGRGDVRLVECGDVGHGADRDRPE